MAVNKTSDNQQKVLGALDDSFEAGEPNLFKLSESNVFLNLQASDKEQAIRFAGEQLVKGGYVEAEYVPAMLEREKLTSTYLGESIAVPHGTIEAKTGCCAPAWCSASTRRACASARKRMKWPAW